MTSIMANGNAEHLRIVGTTPVVRRNGAPPGPEGGCTTHQIAHSPAFSIVVGVPDTDKMGSVHFGPMRAKEHKMSESRFMRVADVATRLEISTGAAYRVIRDLNNELKDKGFMTITGRVSKRFFEERFYDSIKQEV